MGTEVLRPQDLLAERFRDCPASFHHRRKYSPTTGNKHLNYNINNNYHGYRNAQKKKPHHHHHHQQQQQPSFDDFKFVTKHAKNNINQNEFCMKKVTILRRGASLDSLNEKIKKTSNLFPDTMYAGSAFSVSPSPSDLPLPTFFKKHQSFDDSASRNLRRLLRLE